MTEVPQPSSDHIYRSELLAYIQAKIDEHPRSHQAQIGPSEIGGCPTKVAWKITHGGESDREGGWAAAKGSVLHAWLDEHVFGPQPSLMPDGTQRWYSDLKLEPVVDWVNGGTLDLYDKLMQTVVDFKLPGDWTMKSVRAGKLSPAYYIQSQVYALGLERMGYPISKTALLFLPMCGDDLSGAARGAVLKVWPYERQVALDALERVAATKRLVEAVGLPAAMEMLPKISDFCSGCPAFVGNKDRRATCPGVTGKAVAPDKSADPFA